MRIPMIRWLAFVMAVGFSSAAAAQVIGGGSGCSVSGTPCGTAATAATGTSGHTIGFLDGANTWSATQTFTPPANSTPVLVSGYSLTGADTHPILDLSGTWNTTGVATGIKFNVVNTASGASSLLMDLEVGATSKFSVDKNGLAILGGTAFSNSYGLVTGGGVNVGNGSPTTVSGGQINLYNSSVNVVSINQSGVQMYSSGVIKFSSGSSISPVDTGISRSAAATVAIGNGTASDTSGTLRAKVLGTPTGFTVSTLPTGTTGDRAFVTDATSCTFLGSLTGGGSTFCPVVFNGTSWVGG